jgi:hypothetical protein
VSTEILDDDLFDSAEPEPIYGVDIPGRRRGRYIFPAPPGYPDPARTDWMRMTNLVGAFSDQKALQRWLDWKTFEGLREHEIIFDEWMAEPLNALDESHRMDLACEYAEIARQAARADEGARRGTARHQMMDTYFTTGEVTGTRAMRAQLASLREALDRAGLDVLETERHVWHPAAGGTVGRLDLRVMCRRTGQAGITDLKTQARFWTLMEISGQLYGYESADWQWEGPLDARGRWVRPPVVDRLLGRPGTALEGRPVAIVAHMPQEPGPDQLPVRLLQVPLDYGRRVLELAEQVVELRSAGRSASFPFEDFPA